MTEEWRPISGYEDHYEVSSAGRVRNAKGVMIRFGTHRGYFRVILWRCNTKKTYSVARLVLLTFIGPCPPNHEGAHLNGKRQDNRIENLAWVTPKENASHRKLHGTHLFGETQHNARLTKDIVIAIIDARNTGMSVNKIAELFGLGDGHVNHIVSGRTWKHVSAEHLITVGTLPHGYTGSPGERHPQARLTREIVSEIRALPAGMTSDQIAAKYGISPGHARNIRSGRSWGDLRRAAEVATAIREGLG